MFNQRCFKVSELAALIKGLLEENFPDVKVQGEVSGIKSASSGHTYFALKDQGALLNAVCWRNALQKTQIKIEEGMEVVCCGKLSSYQGRSSYQLVVHDIKVAGVGTLLAMLEKRKKALAAEGLFDADRKKKLPKFPSKIGVITSLNGVVIQDILHRIKERFPVHILIWDVPVQGNTAATQIAAAVRGFNAMNAAPDLIILARGGGSVEDLWCFNEEEVVRSIAGSEVPIISAVGHETDFTLADLAADYRAPTPTAAAEIAVPVLENVREGLTIAFRRCIQATKLQNERYSMALMRCSNAMSNVSVSCQMKMQNLSQMQYRVKHAALLRLEQLKGRLTLFLQLLEMHDQNRILKRGFAIIRDVKTHDILTSADMMLSQMEVVLELQDGCVFAVIKE